MTCRLQLHAELDSGCDYHGQGLHRIFRPGSNGRPLACCPSLRICNCMSGTISCCPADSISENLEGSVSTSAVALCGSMEGQEGGALGRRGRKVVLAIDSPKRRAKFFSYAQFQVGARPAVCVAAGIHRRSRLGAHESSNES